MLLTIAVRPFLHAQCALGNAQAGVRCNDDFDRLLTHGNHPAVEISAFQHEQSCIIIMLPVNRIHGYRARERCLSKIDLKLLTDLQPFRLFRRNFAGQIPAEALHHLAER